MNPHLPDWFSFYKFKNDDNSKSLIEEIMSLFDSYKENNSINLELFIEDLKFITSDKVNNFEQIFYKKLFKLLKSIDKSKILKEELKNLIENSFSQKMKSREYSDLVYELINNNNNEDLNYFNRKFTINENLKLLLAKSNVNFEEFVDKALNFNDKNGNVSSIGNNKSSLISKDDLHNILFKEIEELEKIYK